MREKALASGRQADVVAAAGEQTGAQLLLEQAHAGADRRRGHEQPLRRAGEMAHPVHLQEGTDQLGIQPFLN